MKNTIFLVVLLLYFSCNQDKNPETTPTSQEVKKESKITKSTIEKLQYQDYLLDAKARKIIENWPKFQELVGHIKLLKQAEFSFLGGDKETIIALVNDLKAETPETLKTNPITSRIVVLETTILKLHNELNLDNPNRDELLISITEVLSAMSNLNLQINKKIEFDVNNIDRPE